MKQLKTAQDQAPKIHSFIKKNEWRKKTKRKELQNQPWLVWEERVILEAKQATIHTRIPPQLQLCDEEEILRWEIQTSCHPTLVLLSPRRLSIPARCLEDPTHFSLHPNWNALISADQEQPTPNQTRRLRHQGNALLRLMRILQAALMDTGSITLARPSCSTGRAMWRAEELGSSCFWLDINSLRKPSSWRSFLFEQWPCCTSCPRKQALPNSSPSLLMCCTWSGQPCFFILGFVLFRM